jgi:hypothetical protein
MARLARHSLYVWWSISLSDWVLFFEALEDVHTFFICADASYFYDSATAQLETASVLMSDWCAIKRQIRLRDGAAHNLDERMINFPHQDLCHKPTRK